MKLIKLTLFIVFLILLSNCTKDESPSVDSDTNEGPSDTESEVYFTYTGALGVEVEEWIMVYDENGDLLDSKLIENNETHQFQSKNATSQVSDKITVTRLTSSSNNINFLMTFADISKGSIWNKPPESTNMTEPIVGRFNIEVENAPSLKSYTLSTSLGNVPNDLDYDQTTTIGQISSLRLDGVPLFENQDYLLSFFNQQDEHRYIYLENPSNNMQYSFDYSELSEFDSYLQIDFSNNSSRTIIKGYRDEPINFKDNAITLGDVSSFSADTYQIGYLDIFTKFRTSIFANIDGDQYSYIKMGDKLNAITTPFKSLIEIENNTVYNFEFSSDTTHVRKNARWITPAVFPNITPTTTWTVISSSSKSHSVPMVPNEILDQYPDLQLEELGLFTLQLFTQSDEYQSYFDSNFENYEIREDVIQESFTYYYEQ